MLCSHCRRQVRREAASCGACGAGLTGAAAPCDLVLRDGTRVPLVDSVTIGRAPGNTVRIADPSVSRHHARILSTGGGPALEDAGSSFGTFVDGAPVEARTPLRDGAAITLGDVELGVERRSDHRHAGRTVVVRPGASLVLPRVGPSELRATSETGLRPRVRSGWALKRLDASEGAQRYVLKDLRKRDYVRLSEADAELFRLLDGRRTMVELVGEAERRFGGQGPGRLAGLLADLAERGLLEGSAAGPDAQPGRLSRLLRPRELSVAWLGPFVERAYTAGGFLLFTRPAVVALILVAAAGLIAFALLVAQGAAVPFSVQQSLGLGALAFLVGRLALVSSHELAHGLASASFGRRVSRAGLKLALVFPYAFVDTSDAWFEPRRRRVAISLAGPASDAVLGGALAASALAAGPGVAREICFQVALGAYVGLFYNLNPLLDRDGYHVLVDLLRVPNLRRRSRERVARGLAGRRAEPAPRALTVYGAAALAWAVCGTTFAVLMSLRFVEPLAQIAPPAGVWAILGLAYAGLLAPVAFAIGWPLVERMRGRRAGVAAELQGART
jgi:putative peptide zinc metalloprotease protein